MPGTVVDYADKYIIIEGEVVELESSYLETFEDFDGLRVYITSDINFCLDEQSISTFKEELEVNATAWYHINNGSMGANLFVKWTDAIGDENTFGLEFVCTDFEPPTGTEPSSTCNPTGIFGSAPYNSDNRLRRLKNMSNMT